MVLHRRRLLFSALSEHGGSGDQHRDKRDRCNHFVPSRETAWRRLLGGNSISTDRFLCYPSRRGTSPLLPSDSFRGHSFSLFVNARSAATQGIDSAQLSDVPKLIDRFINYKLTLMS
jgi:hypothetical protein